MALPAWVDPTFSPLVNYQLPEPFGWHWEQKPVYGARVDAHRVGPVGVQPNRPRRGELAVEVTIHSIHELALIDAILKSYAPPRTLIVKPSNWHSLGKAVTVINGGQLSTRYPPAMLTDGSGGAGAFRFREVTGSVRINLASGNTKPVNLFGICGHNFVAGQIVNVQASQFASMSPLLVNRGFAVRGPSCWVDLRDLAVTADYWQLNFVNQWPVPAIGELIVAYADEYEGIIDAGSYKETLTAQAEMDQFEYGAVTVSASGSVTRTLPLTLHLFEEDLANLNALDDEAGLSGTRVIVVPDSRRNDLWLVDWPDSRSTTYPASITIGTQNLTIIEEAFGAY